LYWDLDTISLVVASLFYMYFFVKLGINYWLLSELK